jgi:hypothetical protein
MLGRPVEDGRFSSSSDTGGDDQAATDYKLNQSAKETPSIIAALVSS